MTRLSTPLKGIIYGRTIELENEPGLRDGQEVVVTVEAVDNAAAVPKVASPTDAQQRGSEAQAEVEDLMPGEGLKRSFGAWAEDAEELDAYLASTRQRRKLGRPGIEP